MHTFKSFIALFAFIALAFASKPAFAFDVPPKPDNGWYIRDAASKLSTFDIQSLNQKIESFNRSTKNEIGVLIVPTIGDASIEDVAHDVFHSWGIGKAGLDNGILVIIAANDHKFRIETGKGAEGDVPDSIAKEITGSMKPYLRKNDYAGAVDTAVSGLTKVMEDRSKEKAVVSTTDPNALHENPASNSDGGIILIVLGLFALGGLGTWLLFFRKKNEHTELYDSLSDYQPPAAKPAPYIGDPFDYAPLIPAATKRETPKQKESSHSSSSYDSGSSSSSDFGSSFGGGDSGGGGSSDSW